MAGKTGIDKLKAVVGIAEPQPITDEQDVTKSDPIVDLGDFKVIKEKGKEVAGKAKQAAKDKKNALKQGKEDKGKADETKSQGANPQKDTSQEDKPQETKPDDSKSAKPDVLPGVIFPTADVVRATKSTNNEEDTDMAATAMKGMDFYNTVGNKIYDVDRGMAMDSDLRGWIISQFARDKGLSDEIIRMLPAIVNNNPEYTAVLKDIIRNTAEANIPYVVTYWCKSDGKEYESRVDAEAAVKEDCEKYGLKFSQAVKLAYRKVDSKGNLGAKVDPKEVEAFIARFDGDREALRKKLLLPKHDNDKRDNHDQKQDDGKGRSYLDGMEEED